MVSKQKLMLSDQAICETIRQKEKKIYHNSSCVEVVMSPGFQRSFIILLEISLIQSY